MEGNTALKNYKGAIIIAVLIALQLFRIIYVFNYEKEGYHSDELWGYGLSNSYYDPFLFTTGKWDSADDPETMKNVNEWISGEVFRDYLVVGKEERFAYASVIYNQSLDVHPPMHYLILHTICSFFPGSFSRWYSFSINVVAFVLIQLLLFFISKRIFNSEKKALLTVLFYGFTLGACETFVFIRMYALVTLWVVLLSYLHMLFIDMEVNADKCLNSQVRTDIKSIEKSDNKKAGISKLVLYMLLLLTTMAGALTDYFFVAFAFAMAIVFCIWLLIRKSYKTFIGYGLSMALGIVGMILVFPAFFAQIGANTGYVQTKIPMRLATAYLVHIICSDLLGLDTPIYKVEFWCYVVIALVMLLLILAALSFIFRNEGFLQKLIARVKAGCAFCLSYIKGLKKYTRDDRSIFLAAILLGTAAEIFMVMRVCNIYSMAFMSDRYIFCTYPIFCILLIGLFLAVFKGIKAKKVRLLLTIIVTIAFAFASNALNSNLYLFERNTEGMSVEEATRGKHVVLSINEPWLMVTYPQYFMNADSVYVFLDLDYRNLNKKIGSLPMDDKEVYYICDEAKLLKPEDAGIVVDRSMVDVQAVAEEGVELQAEREAVFEEVKKIQGATCFEKVGSETNFGRPISIYRLR